uniref:Uncharacterized protein n=1 Tax=Anguilla anguilla TaxID=7936 RepID=A0A0E9Q715_ANGAN
MQLFPALGLVLLSRVLIITCSWLWLYTLCTSLWIRASAKCL